MSVTFFDFDILNDQHTGYLLITTWLPTRVARLSTPASRATPSRCAARTHEAHSGALQVSETTIILVEYPKRLAGLVRDCVGPLQKVRRSPAWGLVSL